jgi:RHS repeat-associated protein
MANRTSSEFARCIGRDDRDRPPNGVVGIRRPYADQRFYASTFGRFMSADPFKQAAKASDSGSWNKYAYVQDDPVNHTDRHGQFTDVDPIECYTLDTCDFDPGPEPVPAPGPDPGPILPRGSDDPPCDPMFLNSNFSIKGPDGLKFSGDDINLAARVVYAESSSLYKEQLAVANVIYNRLENPGYRDSGQTATTLTMVVTQKKQFNAITDPGPSPKFNGSAPAVAQDLNPAECLSLQGAVASVIETLSLGPQYSFTKFLGGTFAGGTHIGGSTFW